MTTPPTSTLVMLGLAGTGKTNFLVALDVVLDHQSDPSGLRHASLAADRTYLQPLREQWLRGEELLHTTRNQPPPPHYLLVEHAASGLFANLELPDLAGEIFDSHFETRSFPEQFCERLQSAAGLLFFVHCNHDADHDVLAHIELMDVKKEGDDAPGSSPEPEVKWELSDAARQVKLVELLQFIEDLPRETPLRVAVLISAWDLVEGAPRLGPRTESELPRSPAAFLKVRWPLLSQFLANHVELFPSRVFGVSARGGGKTSSEIARLVALERPVDRVAVVDGEHRSNDLSRPVRWLLGVLDEAARD